ncbi:arginine--tRNA ligase [Xanthobacter versatilis]|uniref:Arginine--tRNA ligase n=1 Tax=Xanthobacter autotrophicus (strain ATCC BAA-1158 / Py2) TaxID=78245 RepID=SYR_XANP2|nr:RecName: Full=Arginine--tRNA ligase; AltName: Full=Arginyl-tRNA synthetase; Short=ArgRS [Xanthobacter autotrophicus Py2]ABS69466.1 arginyl-tRNA synthetase [Xanthobacter autotrophicus Py2]
MNVYAIFADHVREAVAALVAEGIIAKDLDLARVVVEPPRDASHGDLATNAAMVLAKDAGLKPRELAERIAGKLGTVAGVKKVDVAGPGFINIALDGTFWPVVLAAVLTQGLDFGRSALGAGEKVNVEYVSANPTGPMHVGHCRGAVFGDALARLMDFAGFAVTKEYYINDAGAQVDVLARSAFLRYREALGEAIGEIPEGLYPGDYLVPVGQKLAAAHGPALKEKSETDWLPLVRAEAIATMMVAIREDLAALGISFDVFFSERSLSTGAVDRVGAAIEALRASGEVYEGRLPPPKGAPIEDWEDREQTLFRSTDFGDDVDRPLKKSDGSYTYFAGDIAYHKDKVDRGFLKMIDVWGADHGGYVKRMQAAVKAVSGGRATLDVELIQLVRLFRAGEPVRMSKRSGSFVTLREVVDEVGRDAVRFMMLFRKNDAPLDFDLAKVIEQSRENPVFYVQYAHARAKSILRNAAEEFADLPQQAASFATAPLARLDDEGEITLLRRLASWPRLVEQAAGAREPHRISFFLHELASEFHGQWNRGKDLPHLRFIIENDRELTSARLALVHGVATVLASGLKVLGVTAVDEMK